MFTLVFEQNTFTTDRITISFNGPLAGVWESMTRESELIQRSKILRRLTLYIPEQSYQVAARSDLDATTGTIVFGVRQIVGDMVGTILRLRNRNALISMRSRLRGARDQKGKYKFPYIE